MSLLTNRLVHLTTESPPNHTRHTIALLGVLALMYISAFGAKSCREELVYKPVCGRACGRTSMKYESVGQARKSDRAVSCYCVGSNGEHSTLHPSFFSDNSVVEFVAGELASTWGVFVGFAIVAFGVVAVAMKRTPEQKNQ